VNKFLEIFWKNAQLNSGLDAKSSTSETYGYEWAGNTDDFDETSPLNPYKDFLPAKKTFYNYQGSLTTYPCTEGVTWILYADPVYIPDDHLEKIRATVAVNPDKITDPVTGNSNRPIQPLNGRTVYKYIDRSSSSTANKGNSKTKTVTTGFAIGGVCAFLFLSVAGGLFYRSSRKSGKAAVAKAKNVKEQDPEVGVSSEQLFVEEAGRTEHYNNNSETQLVALKKEAAIRGAILSEVDERSEQETIASDSDSEEEGASVLDSTDDQARQHVVVNGIKM
jgi:hypothetical protein